MGAVTVRRVRSPIELPLAAIPLIFGLQQIVEGFLWNALPAQSQAVHPLTVAYLLFSNVLWPIYVPLAVWQLEPRGARRRMIAFSIFAGAATSIFFMAALVIHPVSVTIDGLHLKYQLPHPHHTIAFVFYVAATCLAPLLSSHKWVRVFGAVLVVSMVAAHVAYALWFASVWCFFAALASAIIFMHFSGLRSVNR